VPPKKCLVTGCHARALPGNSRCETHRLKSWSNAPPRPDLRTREWTKLSKERRAAFPICEVPGCTRPSTSTDHVIPVSEGGTAEWGNLQALCTPHHREKTLRESHRAAKRKAESRKA
jgi:5-methylcytosine-specific restriction protein A